MKLSLRLIRLLVAAVVLLLLSSENQTVVLSLSYDEEGIWTEKIEGLLDEETCANLIREAENIGFPKTEVDSIDSYVTDVPSLSLDVFFEGDTLLPSIQTIYEPHLPKIFDIVSERKLKIALNATQPRLDWVFIRKYDANHQRKSLLLHADGNLMTINIALNHDFTQGGLFYTTKPFRDGANNFPSHLLDYDGINAIKSQRNKSGLVFPQLKTGDAFLHNFSVYHAVAPIKKGIRYSLILFYDSHHEGALFDNEGGPFYSEDGEEEEDEEEIYFYDEEDYNEEDWADDDEEWNEDEDYSYTDYEDEDELDEL